jgi:hypothetical protein
MPQAYSRDRLERVVGFVEEGHSRRGGAFQSLGLLCGEPGESLSHAGSLEPKPSGGRRHAKLEPHRTSLLARSPRRPTSPCRNWWAELAAATGQKADPRGELTGPVKYFDPRSRIGGARRPPGASPSIGDRFDPRSRMGAIWTPPRPRDPGQDVRLLTSVLLTA